MRRDHRLVVRIGRFFEASAVGWLGILAIVAIVALLTVRHL
jgi:hypothetical protein